MELTGRMGRTETVRIPHGIWRLKRFRAVENDQSVKRGRSG